MTILTLDEYFGPWKNHHDATAARRKNAGLLVDAVVKLSALAIKDGIVFCDNPNTQSVVSGQQFGGFRPQCCSQGAPKSSHKDALAVDLFDPAGKIDAWCLANIDKLEACKIYIEHPSATKGWSHWTLRPPKSGRRVFYP